MRGCGGLGRIVRLFLCREFVSFLGLCVLSYKMCVAFIIRLSNIFSKYLLRFLIVRILRLIYTS